MTKFTHAANSSHKVPTRGGNEAQKGKETRRRARGPLFLNGLNLMAHVSRWALTGPHMNILHWKWSCLSGPLGLSVLLGLSGSSGPSGVSGPSGPSGLSGQVPNPLIVNTDGYWRVDG